MLELVYYYNGFSLSFSNRLLNKDDYYVILKALSCKEFTLSLRPFLRNIQTNRQCPNWDITNYLWNWFLFFEIHVSASLANTLRFSLAFLQRLFVWFSKGRFEFKIVPSRWLLSSDMMVLSSILAFMLSFPENIVWLFPPFILT